MRSNGAERWGHCYVAISSQIANMWGALLIALITLFVQPVTSDVIGWRAFAKCGGD